MGYGVWGVPGWVVFGVLYSKFLVRGMMNTEHRTPNVEVLVISLGHPGACAGKYAANTPFTQHPSPNTLHPFSGIFFHRRTSTNQISVAVGLINSAHGSPELPALTQIG